MTPDERDRLTTLEVKMEGLERLLAVMAGDLSEIKEAAHMGKGAWLLLLKLGGVLTALAIAVAWIVDHVGALFVGKHP